MPEHAQDRVRTVPSRPARWLTGTLAVAGLLAACSSAPAAAPHSDIAARPSSTGTTAAASTAPSTSPAASQTTTASAATPHARHSRALAARASAEHRVVAARPTAARRTHTQAVARRAVRSPSDGPLPLSQPENVFGTGSVWRQAVTSAPLASDSSGLVTNLVGQVDSFWTHIAAFNVDSYNVSWYNAAADQPTTTLRWSNCQHKPYTPKGLFGRHGQFVHVPIPSGAVTSVGTDSELTVYQASTNRLWDFWQAGHDANGWYACWGGRIDHVGRSRGYFTDGFGATATGLASEAGDISLDDVRSGHIDHAIALQIPAPATWTDVSWPAQRSDGYSTSSTAIPEGTRLRLSPSVDIAALHLDPIAAMIARAAQTYGFIVTDTSGVVAVAAESGVPTQQATHVDPWPRLLHGTPSYEVMKNFPWQDLQALPKNWGRGR